MRVAFTLEQCWHAVPGGTASSAIELARALDRLGTDVVGVAARHSAPPPPPWRPPVPVAQLPLPRIALYEAWHALRWPPVSLATGPIDVVHATTLALPPKRGPLVVTVHDLAFLRTPEHFTAHGLRFFRRGLALAQRAADLVLVPSAASRDDCVAAGFPAARVRVIPWGVAVPAVTSADVDQFRARYGLRAPYLLWCGTVEPRKNLPTLLAAFARLRRSGCDLDLVLVGPRGWGDVQVPAGAAELSGVHWLGFLPAAELQAAYAGAAVFCYPSTWEGFGLPVLEAMAHGTPVVTSAGTPMAEFASDGGVLIDPLDAAAIEEGVRRAVEQRGALSAAARARAAEFTWERCARAHLEAYASVLAR